MPTPTLSSATHAPVWQAVIAWVARAGAFFGCTASTTVSELKRAFLAADKGKRGEIYYALREAECIVQRLLVAAALALRIAPSNAPPSRARPASNAVPDFKAMPDESDPFDSEPGDGKKDKTPKPFALYVPPTVLIDDPDAWLKQQLSPAEKLIDADAEDFARRYLALGRLLANPDAAIRRLAQRFAADRRRALDDVIRWDDAMQDERMSSATWPAEFRTAHDLLCQAINAFDIFAEPG